MRTTQSQAQILPRRFREPRNILVGMFLDILRIAVNAAQMIHHNNQDQDCVEFFKTLSVYSETEIRSLFA